MLFGKKTLFLATIRKFKLLQKKPLVLCLRSRILLFFLKELNSNLVTKSRLLAKLSSSFKHDDCYTNMNAGPNEISLKCVKASQIQDFQ